MTHRRFGANELLATFLVLWCAVASAEKKDYQVSSVSDDAEEAVSSGNMNFSSTDLELVSDGGTAQLVGIRFQAVEIPQGATITGAVIEFETDETNTGATSVTIRGEDIDDAPTFTTTNSNISNRTLTTASVAWNSIPAWSTVSERHLTPDLTAIVQEIVDRGGWASGNDMVFVITGSGERTAESSNGEAANAPILRVEFDGLTPAPGSALCYGAADSSNRFVFVDVTDGTVDTNVGPLGASSVEALAVDPNGLDAYGADADELGRIDTDTGAFVRLTEPFGTGGGSAGNITFDDVDSLAFDHDTGTLWGVDARGGSDALFQIDPDTGAHVPDAFGVGTDYVLITGTGIGTQIDDIAIDPTTGTMYGSDTSNSQLITINTATGAGTAVGAFGGTVDMEGMGFHSDGTLYGTEGQRLYTVNTSTGAATQVGSGDTLTVGGDYEGFDCHFTALARAVVTRFDATTDGGLTVVEWETASEDGTAGFYLYRFDYRINNWQAMHEGILPALVGSPQGGTYRFPDETGLTGPLLYALIEVEVTGRVLNRGMYAPRAREAIAKVPTRRFTRTARRQLRHARRRLMKRLSRPGRRGTELKIRVPERGMVFVSATAVAEALSDPTLRFWVTREIAGRRVSLSRGGEEISWLASPDGSGLIFYGRGVDSIYGDDDIYRLQFVAGKVMRSTRLLPAGRVAGGLHFVDTTDFEKDRFPATVVARDPEDDYWFWESISAGSPSYGKKTFTLGLENVATGRASLEVRVYGATSTGLAGEHRVVVRATDVEVGAVSFSGIGPQTFRLDVPSGVLNEGGNDIEVEGVLGEAPYSILYVDGFALSYPRRYEASGDRLFFRGDDNGAISLTGFSATPFVFDITQPGTPRLVSNTSAPGFTPQSPSHQYFATTAAGFVQAELEPWVNARPRLRSRANRADYLVISADDLLESARKLADYRSSQGLETKIVTRSEIENAFTHGFRDPNAVRRFLERVERRWQKAPRFVVLVGEGSLDYKNLLGQDDSLISPVLRRGAHGIYASDNALAANSRNSALPAMAIGRIPVASEEELDSFLEKLKDFENGARLDELLMLSDAPDIGGAFATDSDRIARALGSHVESVPISLEHVPVGLARSQLFTKLRAGASFVTYAGHGGLDRFANAGLLTSADVSSLDDSTYASIFVSLSCSTNRFDIPGFDSLGENLIRQHGGGAIAVWGPSGLTAHGQTSILGQVFLEEVFVSGHDRLGDAVLGALRRYAQLPDADRLLTTFNLLGDPATLLPR